MKVIVLTFFSPKKKKSCNLENINNRDKLAPS